MSTTAMPLNPKERKELAISEIVLIVLGVIGLGVVVWIAWLQPGKTNRPTKSYADCVAAGNPVQESYPSVCVDKQGKQYVNPAESADQPAGQELVVREWKVALPLQNSIKDAYYTYNKGEKTAYVTTKNLEATRKKVAGCTSGLHGIYLERLQPGDSKSTLVSGTWTEQSLQESGARKVGAYYYHEKGIIETMCIAEGTEAQTVGALKQDLHAALQSLQSTE